MANADFAFGLQPIRRFGGGDYTNPPRRYYVPASYAFDIYAGDPVVKTGGADAAGYSQINLATAGGNITGVVVGFEDQGSLVLGYGKASTLRAVLVADDPELLFEVQEDGVGGALSLNSTGLNCDLVPGVGDLVNRTSGWMLDSSTAGTGASLQAKIVEFARRPNNIPGAPKSKIWVKINKHTETGYGSGPAIDTTPDAFVFTDITGATISTVYTSNTITITGMDAGASAAVTIVGGTYSKNGGGYVSTAGTAQNGDTFSVRQTSSASNSTSINVTLTVGGVSDTYTVTTTASVDTTPDAFTFTDITGATTSTVYTSNTITVAGMDVGASAAVTITGGTYSKNGGGYTSSAGTAQNGDTFSVRQTSSGSASTAINVTLTIGGVSDTYTVTTAGVIPLPTDITNGQYSWHVWPEYSHAGNFLYAGYTQTNGHTIAAVYNETIGGSPVATQDMFTAGEADDHNGSGALVLASGNVLFGGCPHNEGVVMYMQRWNGTSFTNCNKTISGLPGNISYWQAFQEASGRIRVHFRSNNGTWWFMTSTDEGATWSAATQLLAASDQVYMAWRYNTATDTAYAIVWLNPDAASLDPGPVRMCELACSTGSYSTGAGTLNIGAGGKFQWGSPTGSDQQMTAIIVPSAATPDYSTRPYDLSVDGTEIYLTHFEELAPDTTGVNYIYRLTGSRYTREGWTSYAICDSGKASTPSHDTYFGGMCKNNAPHAATYSFYVALPATTGATTSRLELWEGSDLANLAAFSRYLVATASNLLVRPFSPVGASAQVPVIYETFDGYQVTGDGFNMINPVIHFTKTAAAFTAPIISTATVTLNTEGQVLSLALTANIAVTWQLSAGSPDTALTELSGTNLRWLANTTRDFDAPANNAADNIYLPRISALASGGASTQVTLNVVVTTDAAGTAWTHSDDAGIKAWLDAADAGATPVASIATRTGTFTLTAAGSARPAYSATGGGGGSYARITGDGVANFLRTTTNVANLNSGAGSTDVAITFASHTTNAVNLLAYGTNSAGQNRSQRVATTTNYAGFSDGNASLDDNGSGAWTSGYRITITGTNGTGIFGRTNGANFRPLATTTRTNTANGTTNFTLFASTSASPSSFFGGDFLRGIITTTTAVPMLQRHEGKGAWDTGLVSLLPANHPFKINPPTA